MSIQLTTAAIEQLRDRPGFPIAPAEAIIDLSDPPLYTACPNPALGAFIAASTSAPGEELDPGGPYLGDLAAEGRHPVYAFHPYHTKVPPGVIRRLIEHYTRPGELVLDPFCGSGMTGVAASEAGRRAILCDLAPVATFIAGANTISHGARQAASAMQHILEESEARWARLYKTRADEQDVAVNYYVWCDLFTCPSCGCAFPIFPHGVIHYGTRVETRPSFPCPACDDTLTIRRIRRIVDHRGKQKVLVWVNAGGGRGRVNRPPDAHDLALADAIETLLIPDWYPTDAIDPEGYSAKLAQLGDKAIDTIDRLLSRRNLIVFADLWARAGALDDPGLRHICRATLTSVFTVISERQGYFGGGGGMSGKLYMPIVRMEKNIYAVLRRRLRRLVEAEQAKAPSGRVIVSTQSATRLDTIPDATIDYIYTDPPFGANIIYSEMNLQIEGWLRVKTNSLTEAVIDPAKGKDQGHYSRLIGESLRECYRVLRPGRWITIEFHNTDAAVWNLLQMTLAESGFVIAAIGVIDKGSTTILSDIRPGAVKHDLLISAYKPKAALERRFALIKGSEEGAWAFVREHLATVPVATGGPIIAERRPQLLFDRMVAFHMQRGAAVPLSAAEFYAGLRRHFAERDGMYFLETQLAAYEAGQ